ncbi:MAG: radical SAM protein, partial [bacterium]|nr:radical SAM protein [bacterium]
MDSIYWVLSRDCNQQCRHCYNDSMPGAPGLELDAVAPCVAHLPDPARVPVGKVILSGGEPLVWPDLLFEALNELHTKYGEETRLEIQTNGDLLDEPMLVRLLDHHVTRIDVSSQDKFHAKESRTRKDYLLDLFDKYGLTEEGDDLGYCFWGANPETWIGSIWPRGRGLTKKASKAKPEDRFCSGWSG